MDIRYSVKSNSKNKLIERTFYKKQKNILFVEKVRDEFNVISINPLAFSWGGNEKYITLSDFKEITNSSSVDKLFFSSGISVDVKKIIRKLSKGWEFEEGLRQIGWQFFDKTIKVFGESEINKIPLNHLSLQGTEIEISCHSISNDEFKEYLENGISSEEYDDISTSGDSGFCETDSKFTVNDEEVNIKKELEKEFKKKNSDENLFSKITLPAIVVAHYFKRSYATIDILEEFDPKKLTLNVEKYVYKTGVNGHYSAYLPMYEGQNFDFESSGLHNYTDILLIDAKGKTHSIDISESDEDEDEN